MLLATVLAVAVAALSPPRSFNCSSQPAGTFDPITIKNKAGLTARFIRYGATLTHLMVRDSGGTARDVALGWDDAIQYCANPEHTYFGATIGRIANRIANGTFSLGGKTYTTPLNDHGIDTLHGGWVGFDRRVWTVLDQSESSVKFGLESLDGDMGFPGTVHINVTHTVTEDNEWVLLYEGTTEALTVLAMTNHVYLNLNANVGNTPTVLEHTITMPTATKFVPVDSTLIPTGQIGSVAADAPWLDFTKEKAIGADINRGTVTPTGGYDNAWIFAGWTPGAMLQDVVTMRSPTTGITVKMSTNQPSVQFYSGNFLNGTDPKLRLERKASQSFGKEKQYYQWRGAATLEAQFYPDAVHNPNFPSVELRPGEQYIQHTRYKFSATP